MDVDDDKVVVIELLQHALVLQRRHAVGIQHALVGVVVGDVREGDEAMGKDMVDWPVVLHGLDVRHRGGGGRLGRRGGRHGGSPFGRRPHDRARGGGQGFAVEGLGGRRTAACPDHERRQQANAQAPELQLGHRCVISFGVGTPNSFRLTLLFCHRPTGKAIKSP